MADVIGVLREVMTLTSQVGGLRADVDSLTRRIENHHERIIKLETREEALAQKMANVALQAVNSVTVQSLDKIQALDRRVDSLESAAPKPKTPRKLPGTRKR